MENVNSRNTMAATNVREDHRRDDDYDGRRNWKKPRFNKRDRQPWKRSGPESGYGGHQGGGHWRNGHENHRSKPNTNALIRESVNQKELKPIVFDLSSGRSKMELNDWFKNTAPSKLRRSDNVGWIYILSENITDKDKRNLFESYEGIVALRQEWSQIHDDPSTQVSFETFKDLAKKHDCKIGKWILHGGQIDDIWQNLALAFAYDKFPEGTIALKVSPVDEFEPSGSNNHMICVINRDMTDENEIIGVERAIRNVGIRGLRGDLQYKPNIYTELGIYRNNKFGIRPTVYKSARKHGVDGDYGFEITNLAKEEWIYRYNPDPDQMNPEGDANIKDGNDNLLDDIQAKIELLREAMENVDAAVKSFVKQQGKEKKKKPRKKKSNDSIENDNNPKEKTDGKKINTEEDPTVDDKDNIKENVDIAIDIEKMIKDVVAKIDNGNVKVDEEEIKYLEIKEDFYPKNDEEKVNEEKDAMTSKEKVDGKKKSKDKKKAGKKDGKDGEVDSTKVEEKIDEEADGKKEDKEGEAVKEEEKNMVDEAQA